MYESLTIRKYYLSHHTHTVMFRFETNDYIFPEQNSEEDVCIEIIGGLLAQDVNLVIATSDIDALGS